MSDLEKICVQHVCIEILYGQCLTSGRSTHCEEVTLVCCQVNLRWSWINWNVSVMSENFFLLLFLTFISPLPPSFPPYSRSPSSSLSSIRVSCSPDRTSVETNTLTAMAGQSDFSSPSSSSGVQTQQIKARSQTCFYLAQNHVILKICSK